MKKSILLATSAIIASGVVATSAQAIDVELYGQVNKAVVGANIADDNLGADLNIVDNDISSTRFGLRGNQQLDNGLTASVLIEGELQAQPSNTFAVANGTPGATNDGGGSAWATRHARVGLGGQWGALFVGETSTASDGVAEIDLSAAQDVSTSAADRIGGGVIVDGTNSLAAYADNIDGMGYTGSAGNDQHAADRRNTVRFDTPIVQGLQGRIAYAQGQDIDLAVLYNNTFAGFEVAGGASYVSYGKRPQIASANGVADNAWALTASTKHDSGFSGTVSYGRRNVEQKVFPQDDPKALYVKAGYQYNNTGFAIDYTDNSDAITTAVAAPSTSELQAIGAYVQQDLGHGVSASAFYKQVETELVGNKNPDLDVFGVNMRVKF